MCKSRTQEAQLFLRKLKKLDSMIRNKMVEKEQWKSLALGTTAQMGSERVQTSSSQQRMADAVNRYIDIEKEIDACVDRLVDARNDVIEVIEMLDEEKYDLMHLVYVQYRTLEEAAYMCDKSYSWATTTHGRALVDVQRILEGRRSRGQDKGNQ